jgi:cytochrome c5
MRSVKSALVLTSLLLLLPRVSWSGESGRDLGQLTYQRCCSSCHDTGANGAQRLGDHDGWRARLAQGDDVLLKHTLDGFVGTLGVMPARGECPELGDEDVAAAVSYIISTVR